MTGLKPKAKLEQMINFYEQFLPTRGIDILDVKGNVIRTKNSTTGRQVGIILTNKKQITLQSLKDIVTDARNTNSLPFVNFYKDHENFFVRMVDNNAWRYDESLKLYTKQQINRIISLRNLERYSMFNYSESNMRNFNPSILRNLLISYYQPETARLPESIRSFSPQKVELDYNHKTSKDEEFRFLKNTVSKTYFFLDENMGKRMVM